MVPSSRLRVQAGRAGGRYGDEGLDRAGPRVRAAGGSEMKTLGCQARDHNCLSWVRSGRHFKFEPGVATGSRCSTGKDPSERGPVVVGPVRVGVRLDARCGPGSVARQRLGGQSIPSQPMISCRSRAARGRCSHAGSGDIVSVPGPAPGSVGCPVRPGCSLLGRVALGGAAAVERSVRYGCWQTARVTRIESARSRGRFRGVRSLDDPVVLGDPTASESVFLH